MRTSQLIAQPRRALVIAIGIGLGSTVLSLGHPFDIRIFLSMVSVALITPTVLLLMTILSKARMLRAAPATGGVADLGNVDEKGISLQSRQVLLDDVRVKFGVPGIAGACVIQGQPRTASVAGVRRSFTKDWLQKGDRFHIGSCTKSMTATMLARLVEFGVLDWQMTVADAFPELVVSMRNPYQGVTLEQLLCHRAGFSRNCFSWEKYLSLYDLSGSVIEQRYQHLEMLLSVRPAYKPGTRFVYTNSGYCVAACIAEKQTGKSWEELMQTLVFEPLGMTSTGFGAPGKSDDRENPWGHLPYQLHPVEPGPLADVPRVIAPAASVHCSMEDLGRFVALHARGAHGDSGLLLNPETFAFLHKEHANSKYALGWYSYRDETGIERMWHGGSIHLWHTEIFMWPRGNAAVAVATNTAGRNATAACRAAVKTLVLPVSLSGRGLTQ